jgi:hypothetical protein
LARTYLLYDDCVIRRIKYKMIARVEMCEKCGKKFIIGGVFPQSTCEQCSMAEGNVVEWSDSEDNCEERIIIGEQTPFCNLKGYPKGSCIKDNPNTECPKIKGVRQYAVFGIFLYWR